MTRADDPSATHVLITSLDNIETVTPVLALDLTDLTQGKAPHFRVPFLPSLNRVAYSIHPSLALKPSRLTI